MGGRRYNKLRIFVCAKQHGTTETALPLLVRRLPHIYVLYIDVVVTLVAQCDNYRTVQTAHFPPESHDDGTFITGQYSLSMHFVLPMQVRVDCAVVHDTVSIFSVQCICITNHCVIAMMFVCPSV